MKVKNKNNKNIFIIHFLIINFIIILINIILINFINNLKSYFKILNNKIKSNFIFKNVDLFSLNIAKKSFNNISIYLNSKFKKTNNNFNIKLNNENNKKKNIKKKLIRIYSVGSTNKYYKNFLRNDIIKGLEDKFIFHFTNNNPDYLIFDVKTCEQKKNKYDNAIKIAFLTENKIPDFNQSDYAIGFQNMFYLDRYFRKTTLIWILQRRYLNVKNKDFMEIRKKIYKSKIRKKFCGAVISNFRASDKFRIKFIIIH